MALIENIIDFIILFYFILFFWGGVMKKKESMSAWSSVQGMRVE
jgi:TRAP-type C4-dicarboxylate transport system permease small subunit